MHKPLTEMTPAELRDYADYLEEQEVVKSIPKPLDKIDLEPLKNYCQRGFEDMVTVGIQEDAFMQDIAETALEAIYGREIFNWMNKL